MMRYAASGDGKHVIVIGAGVIGAACAHYLTESGWRVTIIDRGRFGAGCSHANCGYVCPSHVLPLPGPGAVSSALKTMMRRNSPMRVRPWKSLSLMRWLLAFARRCNRQDMLQGGRGIQPLLTTSRALYEGLVRDGIECEWEARGLLFVFQSHAGMEHYKATDELLRTEFGVPATPLAGVALRELEPTLKPGLGGGWLYETDAHLRPDRLMKSWRALLKSRGVIIRENCAMKAFVRDGGQAKAASTADGELSADAFVLAAGAWSPLLNDRLGCRLPIQPGKGYSMTTARPANCPKIPMIFEEHRVAVTPMQSGYRLGSMMEFVGYDDSVSPKRIEYLKQAASLYLAEPVGKPVQETWSGWRPMTPDGLPVIGRSPALSNVMIAAGHNMLGLSMAPGTGKLVAEIMDGRATHIDPGPFSPGRF
ncbi:MAG TPA: FAD-dependent oxidoreductase [Gemmataceae bacterium]|jgi:D-amino-acid dehydrogenase|nr:FAD-dependent oxidoreductase [Gemmataceae bacterium]